MHCANGQIKRGCLNIRLNPTHAISHLDYSSDFCLLCSPLLSKSIKKLLLRLAIFTLLNLGGFSQHL